MAIKLSKVCKELNVGMATAIEFFDKQGYKVAEDLNTRIDDDLHLLLAKAYNPAMAAQIEASRKQPQANAPKTEQPAATDTPKQPEMVKTEVPESERPRVKEVGQIDLNAIDKANKPAEVPPTQPAQQQQAPTTKAETIETPKKVEPKVEATSTKAPKEKEAPKAEPKTEPKADTKPKAEVEPTNEVPAVEVKKATTKVEEVQAEKAEKKVVEETPQQPKTTEPQADKKVPTESATEPTPEKPKEEEEIFRLGNRTLDKVPVVVGTIDLSQINQSTRPKSKTKEQKKKEREERRQAEINRQHGTTAGATAPTAVGAANGVKRKRERIKQGRVDITNPQEQRPANRNNNNNNTSNNNNGNIRRNNKKPVLKTEVNEEDVQRQVKETLARLSAGKSKGGKGAKYRKEKREHVRALQEEQLQQENAESRVLKLTEFVTANELANMMNVPVNKIIATCMSLGLMVSINQRLDAETINIVAEEFDYTTEFVSTEVVEAIAEDDADTEENMEPRAPIVTVMGHVDHGKTSLLDHIRNSNVIAGEAGGITQHIGAYNVQLKSGQRITFLDTPGHEAFTAMRARGAKVTDIAIIIVAADDNVMPQTVEAINHASAAGVPIIFAINKIDKPGANPDKIKEELSAMNYLVEEWGGKYQSQDISAKKGLGVHELLEKVLLEAELLDLKANPKKRATGSIIESSLDKGRGYVSTILVQDGTLHMGDVVLAGTNFGKIKAMFNERNQRIEEVHPGEPALILGLNGAPQAGDNFNVMPTEQEAREIANRREQLQREQDLRTRKHFSLDELGRRIALGDFKELNIIVKGDVDGSVEALSDSLIKLSTQNIQVNVIHKAVGAISDSDIMLAAASNAIICGFQVRPTSTARKLAEKEDIDIRLYSIIYDAIEEIKSAMEGMLAPEIKEEITATLEVQQVFKITKIGTVAGCLVREGKIKRTNKVRIIRDGIVVYTGELESLKRMKDDVKEVGTNFECGLNVKNYNDVREGDLIESFEEVEVKGTLK